VLARNASDKIQELTETLQHLEHLLVRFEIDMASRVHAADAHGEIKMLCDQFHEQMAALLQQRERVAMSGDRVWPVLVLLVELYLTVGLMLIGFACMFAGRIGASRAARWYFGNSLRWSWWRLRLFIRRTVTFLWQALVFWIVRPLSFRLWEGVRWLARRERGWLRPW